jgi:hypothetical protein
MKVTRRTLLKGALGAAGAAALDVSSAGPGSAAAPQGSAATTLAHTLVRGAPGVGGYAPITLGAGEPYLLRGELGQPRSEEQGPDKSSPPLRS